MHLFYSQYGPSITPNNTAFVHHIIVYLCGALVNITEGASSECTGQTTLDPINECRRGTAIGGWAVGGEVHNTHTQYTQKSDYAIVSLHLKCHITINS